MQLEVLQQDLDNNLGLFPMREIDPAALAILFVVALLVPDSSKGVDEGVLVADPVDVVFNLKIKSTNILY